MLKDVGVVRLIETLSGLLSGDIQQHLVQHRQARVSHLQINYGCDLIFH